MPTRPALEPLLKRHAFTDYRWLAPREVRVAEWVRMKCRFGCPGYGRAAACPPNTPEVDACRRFFAEYRHSLIIHFQVSEPDTKARHAWSARTNRALVDLEHDAFLAGYSRAFALFTESCHLCDECVPQRSACRDPTLARPSATAMAVDVFGTARSAGYALDVLTEPSAPVDYFAFLMVD